MSDAPLIPGEITQLLGVTPFGTDLHYVFFTDLFRTTLATNQEIMEGASIRLALFRYAPGLTPPINPAWTGADTLAELKASNPGWVEVAAVADPDNGYPLTHVLPVGTRSIAGSRYVIFSDYPFAELTGPVEVNALAVEYVGTLPGTSVVNPLIFVTGTPVNGGVNLRPGDTLTASPDDNLGADSNRWLFGWSIGAPDPAEGPLMISKGSPDFEVSGSQHTWMYPQRANMIANPSFEKPDTGAAAAFWSGNGTVSRVSGAAPGGGAYHANASGPSPIVAESNVFPTKLGELDSEQWTVQLMAKGNGRLKVGIVYWDVDYRATSVNWGEEGEEWILNYDTWTHVACQRHCPEAHLAMLRMELEGVTFRFDKVLVERGYLRDWPYFDGDEKYGALDDFSWYGGSQRRGASYSLWYNHRRAVVGRLYARTVDPNDPTENVTDEEMEEQGLVYRWVPAGITVVPHMDVFYPHDVQNPVPPKAPGVLPYYDEAIAPDGITNPWL